MKSQHNNIILININLFHLMFAVILWIKCNVKNKVTKNIGNLNIGHILSFLN